MNWIAFFVGIVAVAFVLQTAILAAMFVMLRRANERYARLAEDFRERVIPLVTNIQLLVEDARPHITRTIANASEITQVARTQAQRVDRVMSEALERLRMQLAHVDQILTGALETVEDAGSKFRKNVWEPMQSVIALVRGVQTGLEFYRERGGRRRRERDYDVPNEREQADENLFI